MAVKGNTVPTATLNLGRDLEGRVAPAEATGCEGHNVLPGGCSYRSRPSHLPRLPAPPPTSSDTPFGSSQVSVVDRHTASALPRSSRRLGYKNYLKGCGAAGGLAFSHLLQDADYCYTQ